MDDTISRQAAIDAIERLDIPEDMCVFEILSHIELAILTLPSAQPERKTGRWKLGAFDRIGGYWATCSVCERPSFGGGKYCRYCGADMRTPTQVQLDEADDVMMMGGDNGKTD